MVSMRYADVVVRAPGIATDERLFNLNSTFDPDRTGTGHQPMGRDQLLGTLYGKYRVHSVRYRIEIDNVSNASALFYASMSNDTTAINSPIYNPLEQPMTQVKMAKFVSGQAVPVVLSGSVRLWDILGRSREQYLTDDVTGAPYTTDPSEIIVLKVGASTLDGGTVIIYQYTIQLDMIVQLYDRFTLPNS